MNKQTRKVALWIGLCVILGVVLYGAVVIVKSVPRQDQIVLTEPVTDADWSRGPRDAKVTIVEYSDLQCPACAYFNPAVERALGSLSSESVRFVYRHYPLPQHKNAVAAIRYAEAAGKQSKFFEMIDALFEHQKEWQDESDPSSKFIQYATTLGIDVVKLKIDSQSSEISAKIDQHKASAIRSGVTSTPTFFINGKQVDMPPQVDSFIKVIRNHLEITK